MFTLKIEPKHCKDTIFDSVYNCALSKAMKQQHKEIEVKKVFNDHFIDKDDIQYEFDDSDETGYSRTSFDELKNGTKKQIVLKITVAKKRQLVK